jgi:UDP:flavonoid glycosyltransferase YjiC (YdhE family)
MGRDQDDTAARVVHGGAGIRIKPKSGPETIARAVTQVLRDDRYRTNARRLGDEMAGELRSVDVAVELERIGLGSIARRGAHVRPGRAQNVPAMPTR